MQYKSTKVAMQLGEIFLLLVVLVLVAREGAGASVVWAWSRTVRMRFLKVGSFERVTLLR